MKIAHLILTYTDPLQTERMIRHMYHPEFDFYIHVDKKFDASSHHFLTKIPGVYLIQNTTDVIWGGYDTVKAILRSSEEILASGRKYDYIHLMSGQDYPIKNAHAIHNFFLQQAGKQFLRYEHFNEWDGEGYERIRKYHLTNFHFPGKYIVQNLLNKFLPERKLPKMEFYGYSMFWALTPDCIKYVIDFLNTNHSFRRFMKISWGSDEFIFQTIILNSPFSKQVVNNNLLYYERPYRSPHPNILTYKEFDNVVQSNQLFARKLSLAKDAILFDMLDEYIKEDENTFLDRAQVNIK
jgi:hypothetical protein